MKTNVFGRPEAEPGDVIECHRMRIVIGEIIDQYEDDEYLAIEFKDERGRYRYWKQRYDGGHLEKKGE